jgi:hypothetical protein
MLTASHMAHDLMPAATPSALANLYCKPGASPEVDELRTASQFAPLAMAAYGTLYYVYANPLPSAMFDLCCGLCCGPRAAVERPRSAPQSVVAQAFKFDPTAIMNKAAICAIAGIAHDDLKYVNSLNEFNKQSPYFIALHRESRSVVVSIRGTFR